MQDEYLEMRLVGDDDTLPASSFLTVLRCALTILRDIDTSLSDDNKPRLSWTVESATMNSPLTLSIRPRAKGAGKSIEWEYVREVENAFTEGLRLIESGTDFAPEHFKERTLSTAKIMVGQLDKGLKSIRFATAYNPPVHPTQHLAANVDVIVPGGYTDFATIEGTLETVTVHNGPAFVIYNPIDGRVSCNFDSDETLELVKSHISQPPKRVAVFGKAKYTGHGRPLSIEVSDVEVLPGPADLPRFADMEGSDLAGGRDPAQHVRRVFYGD